MRATALPFMLVVAVSVLAACTSQAEKKVREANVARGAIAAESATAASAATAASGPANGRWDEVHLVERLVRSGLAPQAAPSEKDEAYWDSPLLAYRLGKATLYAHIYPDSIARRRITNGLDSLSAAPNGVASPYAMPHVFLVQNNLAAVLVGGSDRQQDRVSLALTAGLAGPSVR